MMTSILPVLATFAVPENIGTTPASMLWMLPLLAAIAVVYKANKLRVVFSKVLIREVVILFGVLCGFMILAIVVLNLLVWLINQ